jgi:hypothetical protein
MVFGRAHADLLISALDAVASVADQPL